MNVEYDDAKSIGMREACELIRGRAGGTSALEVVRRYAKGGVVVGGVTIVLRAVKIGGVLRTMPEWVADFEKARAAAGSRGRPTPRVETRTPRQRAAGQRRAAAELDRMGVV